MRRTAIGVALLAAFAILATPASAQVQDGWFLNAGVGPAFGTLGSVPAVDGTGGYRFNEHVSVAGEFGLLPHAPFEKAAIIAQPVSPLVPAADLRVNGYHAGGNVRVQPGIWGRCSLTQPLESAHLLVRPSRRRMSALRSSDSTETTPTSRRISVPA
jgi:hypothetical protein